MKGETDDTIYLAALPFYAQFSAGAIAGVTELICLYPLGASICSAAPGSFCSQRKGG